MKRFRIFLTFIIIILTVLGCDNYSKNNELDSFALMASGKLKQKQHKKGYWKSFFSFDTIPEKLRKDVNVWNNLILIDIIRPVSTNLEFDTMIGKALDFVASRVNKSTGLLRFNNRALDYPDDSDDTSLFWGIAATEDTSLLKGVIDTLIKYRSANGLYYIWLSKNGVINKRAAGKNPNPTDFLSNVHVYLFLKKYAPDLAKALCSSLNNDIISSVDYWTYNERCPWLYYIREIDLANNDCKLTAIPDDKVKCLHSQKDYTVMSKLIRDLALGRGEKSVYNKSRKLLRKIARNNFEYINNNPLLMYHNDLSAKKPAYFWSYDLPYALWLRLNYEYKVSFK